MASQAGRGASEKVVRPRNIVPLLTPELREALEAAAPVAHLTHHGGPVLTAVQVQAIFWGAAWQQPAQSALIPQIEQFFTFILQSSLMDLMAEFSIPGQSIGHGQFIGSVTTTTPALGNTVTNDQIQDAIQGWIQDGTVAQPNANTLYFVYLPPGVVSILGNSRSCVNFCGYHDHINGSVFYAVEPFITCGGCNFGSGIFDSLTKVSSHELCEAVTDPALNAWFDPSTGDEIGDICNGGVTELGGFVIQTEFSNRLNACVIAP
jgi:hypothetical protein